MSLSLPVIGKRTGGFDHTTVLHGVRNFKKLLDAGKVKLEIISNHSNASEMLADS